jgi:hypothetical protein
MTPVMRVAKEGLHTHLAGSQRGDDSGGLWLIKSEIRFALGDVIHLLVLLFDLMIMDEVSH